MEMIRLVNNRDLRGWMIPREGTKRRAVYDGLVLGLSLCEIAEGLDITKEAVWQHKEVITNWRRAIARRKAYGLKECA